MKYHDTCGYWEKTMFVVLVEDHKKRANVLASSSKTVGPMLVPSL